MVLQEAAKGSVHPEVALATQVVPMSKYPDLLKFQEVSVSEQVRLFQT